MLLSNSGKQHCSKENGKRSTLYFKYIYFKFFKNLRIWGHEWLFLPNFLPDTRLTKNIALINLTGTTWEGKTNCVQLLKQSLTVVPEQSFIKAGSHFPIALLHRRQVQKRCSVQYLFILHPKRKSREVFLLTLEETATTVGWLRAGASQSRQGPHAIGAPLTLLCSCRAHPCRWGYGSSSANIWDDSNELQKQAAVSWVDLSRNKLWVNVLRMYHVALTHHRCDRRMGILQHVFCSLDIPKLIKTPLGHS